MIEHLEGAAPLLEPVALVVATVLLVWAAVRLVRPLVPILLATRASLLTLLAGFLLLFVAGQGREVVDALSAAPSVHLLWFGLALFYWAIQCWHWSRVELYLAFGSDRAAWAPRAAIAWLPRLYGLAVHLLALAAVAWAALRTRPEPVDLVGPAAVVAGSLALFLAFVLFRLHAFARLERRRPALAAFFTTLPIGKDEPLDEAFLALAPFSRLVLLGSLLFFAWNVVQGGLWPVETAAFYGSAAIAFGALGSWVALLSILALLARLLRFPMIAAAIAVRAALALVYGEHPVRTDPATDWPRDPAAPDGPGARIDPRPSLAEEVARWRESVAGEPGPVPVVFVASAGGGLRAAWWTVTALGRLIERHQGLERKIVAISAVSGGALGATVLVAALAREERRALAEGRAFDPREATRFARDVLDEDFLAPVLAAMLYTEALPPALAERLGMGGRAAALENAWSAAWDRASGGEAWNPLARPFLELRGGPRAPWLPLLFLNATHEERGRRVIASPVPITQPPFLDAFDLHHLLVRDLWTTTAIHNSARFSFVSPAGLLREQGDPNRARGHVLDGGYFENFGAVTAAEAAAAILELLGEPSRWRPIVLQISSDPSLPDPQPAAEAACASTGAPLPAEGFERSLASALNELVAPFKGVLATREARGVHAVAELERRVACAPRPLSAPRPVFVHLAMCGLGGREPALGWALDRRSREAIDRLLDPDGCNAQELAILAEALQR
ncbi:MAG: hypothetical protein NZ555_11895 [Geminicoccaceae bacterium]|nr:hypothetical protein [Geminicoccaceae bacterium]